MPVTLSPEQIKKLYNLANGFVFDNQSKAYVDMALGAVDFLKGISALLGVTEPGAVFQVETVQWKDSRKKG